MTPDQIMQDQEQQIPECARVALRHARQTALLSGHSVLVAQQNQLVEIAPDGSTHVRKQIAAPIRVVRGQKMSRRPA